jgi:lipoate-protein ligase B
MARSLAVATPPVEFRNLGRTDWDVAMREQERVAEARARGQCPDTVLFVEHEPVYTRGLRFRRENFRRQCDPSQSSYCGIPLRRAFRGGELTYHGPGQLVVYPILLLPCGGRQLRRLVAFYQTVTIEVLAEVGVAGFIRPDAIGVWTDRGKIASIGVGLRRGVTRNGFAINVETDLRAFEPIVPCGRPEPMANINDFNGAPACRRISVDDVRALVEKHFIRLSRAWMPTREELSL